MTTGSTTRWPSKAAEQAYPAHDGPGVACFGPFLEPLDVFRQYLIGSWAYRPDGVLSNFFLRTDNQAVTWLRTERDVNQFLTRWRA